VAEFTRNWILPSTLRDDSLTVKARVTIASDGRVVSASVSAKSGDAALDRSVESVLQRVKQVRGFPSGVSSENRTYTIKFKPEFNQGAG
jgi:TonB family protein